MIDLRLWRILLLATPIALLVAMFSLEEVPRPLESSLPPDAFEGSAAVALAADMAELAPEPRPGSEDDQALAEAVLARFKQIPAIEVSEQRFEGSYDGEDVDLRNLIAKLPGTSERQVAVLAGRDVVEGSGAASTVAANAVMLEIAAGFAGSTHEKTLVFVSTDGASIGALGASRFAADYTDAGLLDAVIVLSQPAADDPTPPLVVPWSAGTGSTSARLVQTSGRMVSSEMDLPYGDEGPMAELSRLAIPSALGEQGPLIDEGLDAVRLSSSGELPPAARDDTTEALNTDTVSRMGRAALSLMLAVDSAREPAEHGPDTYIGLAGNLMPGWTLALLALALLLAPVGVGFAGLAAAAGSPVQAARAVGWVLLRAVPFLLAFLVVTAGALVGLVPSPEFPFPPSSESIGTGGAAVVGAAAVLLLVTVFLLRPLLAPPPALARLAPPACIAVASVCALGVWLVNPYMALLVGLGLQLWVLAASPVVPGRLAAAGVVALGTVPVLAAVAAVAGRFDAGPGVVWDLLLMLTGGQLPDRLAVLGCLLAGVALAIVAARGEPADPSQQVDLSEMVARGRLLERRRSGRPEAQEPPDPQPEPKPDPSPQDQPERDPRMWSKPPGSSSRPSSASTDTASWPSTGATTRPIWVRP